MFAHENLVKNYFAFESIILLNSYDFSSFVVMKELGVSQVLTADKHFENVGLGFKKLF